MKFLILIGTMTGNAEIVAEEIDSALAKLNHETTRRDMSDASPADLNDKSSTLIICSSTYGDGEVPDNATDFYNALQTEKPNLKHLNYGIIALGDSVYETFTNGGIRFDTRLQELGASRIGEICRHDASSDQMPEDVALQWLPEWLEEVQKITGAG